MDNNIINIGKKRIGPDQSSSYNPYEFIRLVKNIRNTEVALGSPTKEPCEIEKRNALGMRRSLVAKFDIEQNSVITSDMVTFKRPSTSISPSEMDKIVGKKTKYFIVKDSLIKYENLK